LITCGGYLAKRRIAGAYFGDGSGGPVSAMAHHVGFSPEIVKTANTA
jgi:hypothetical protein